MARQYLVLDREREDAFPLFFEDMMTGAENCLPLSSISVPETDPINRLHRIKLMFKKYNNFSLLEKYLPCTERFTQSESRIWSENFGTASQPTLKSAFFFSALLALKMFLLYNLDFIVLCHFSLPYRDISEPVVPTATEIC